MRKPSEWIADARWRAVRVSSSGRAGRGIKDINGCSARAPGDIGISQEEAAVGS